VLTVLLADSTASAQRTCGPLSSRSKCNAYTRASCSCDERPKAIETYFQAKKLNVRGRAELKNERIRQRRRSASHIGDTKSNEELEQPCLAQGTCSPLSSRSKCNAYTRASCSSDERPKAIETCFQIGDTKSNEELEQPYLSSSSDVERYREHWEAKRDITEIELDTQADISKMKRDAQADIIKNNLEWQAKIEEIKRRHQYRQTTKRALRLARQSAPEWLTESEYNPITGVIRWPSLFHADQRFAENRQSIDALAVQGTQYKGGRGSGHSFEIREATGQMQNTLKNMIRELDGTEYSAAKAFLASLAHQTRLAVEPAIGNVAAK